MKSRVCCTTVFTPPRHGHRPKNFQPVSKSIGGGSRRQLHLLLGMSILVIFGWMIGSIWLINVRRGERSTAEVWEQQATIVALLSAETGSNR